MKRRYMITLLAMSLIAVLCPPCLMNKTAHAERDDPKQLIIDVACDARTYSQNNVDPSLANSHRGDTFIVSGKIYPGGTIPSGNGIFSPDNPGSIGKWICRGVWLVNSIDLANGVSPAFDTSQIYLLPDDSRQIVSEGLEGSAPTLRAVTGGTGSLAGVSGQVRQELLGTNLTGLFNFRFTFDLHPHTDKK